MSVLEWPIGFIYTKMVFILPFCLLIINFFCLRCYQTNLFFPVLVYCREYVQRAFENCETERDKDETEQHLKNMLTSAFKDGSAWVVNWDKEPLPRWESWKCFTNVAMHS